MSLLASSPLDRRRARLWTPGEALAWVAAIVFALSPFLGWYSGAVDGLRVSVVGWDTGGLGKLAFVVGLAALAVLGVRAAGVELPQRVPVGMLVAALGAVATVVVLFRIAVVPDDYVELGRAIGIWISLLAAVLLVVGGLLTSAEES